MVPLLGLIAGIVLGVVLEPSIPQLCSRTSRSPSSRQWMRCSARSEPTWRARSPTEFRRVVHLQRLDRGRDRLHRRPDRHRLTTGDRGRGRPRNSYLHQRRSDRTGAVPCLRRLTSRRNRRSRPCGIALIVPADATPCHDESARCDVVSENWQERRRSPPRRRRRRPRLPPTRPSHAQSPPKDARPTTCRNIAFRTTRPDPGGSHLVRGGRCWCHANQEQRRGRHLRVGTA